MSLPAPTDQLVKLIEEIGEQGEIHIISSKLTRSLIVRTRVRIGDDDYQTEYHIRNGEPLKEVLPGILCETRGNLKRFKLRCET